MSLFDNSMVYCKEGSSGTNTYHSYMCRSKDSYLIPKNYKYVDINDYDNMSSVSQENDIHKKPPHISKLRNILSDTISQITKGNKLQKGESVELTLEIELMKTENNSPTNSLVEVIIIQHNKSEEQTKDSYILSKSSAIKIPFQIEAKSSGSETASQKRRNWFQRIISKQYDEHSLNEGQVNTNREQSNEPNWKMKGDPVFCMNQYTKHNQNKSIAKNNFVTILPEEKTTINGDYTKGYRKVSPNKRTPRPRNIMTASRQKSLVKKLSDIFLPTKKADKNKAVKSALTALKNEVDNMKIVSERYTVNKNSRKRKRAPVHNLGKLVSNILVDMMENSDNTSTNQIQENSQYVQYQSFFEPISKTSTKNKQKKLNRRKINRSKKRIAEAHSGICCVHSMPVHAFTDPTLKTTNSVSDCKSHTDVKTQLQTVNTGDSTEISSKKRNKTGEKTYTKNHGKNVKCDEKNQPNHETESHRVRNRKHNKSVGSKNSLIQWNGQTIQVNKEIKSRIEMLIVNELQNLALKEGMECDVTPLSSTDISTKTIHNVEKLSSFICELDISDNKIQKVMTNKTSLSSKGTVYKSPKLSKKSQYSSNLNKGETCKAIGTTGKSTLTEEINRDRSNNEIVQTNRANNQPKTSKDCILILPHNTETDQNDVELTFLNTNIKNWSAESMTVMFESPVTKEPQKTKLTGKQSPLFEFCGQQNSNNYVASSSFVKIINSNDPTWNNFLSGGDITEKINSSERFSKPLVTTSSTRTAMQFNSTTSNECESNIEIELDIKDLELILKEAKQKQKADKVLISAKCKRPLKKQKKSIKFTGRNSESYTNQLLSSAARKLDKYVKIKR